MLIAKYTANVSGVVPTFNNGYVYDVTENENGGIYTVEINSDNDFTSCSFYGKSNLLTVEYLKVTSNVTNMSGMFNGCNSLTSLDLSNFDTTNVTNMSYMFYNNNKLTSLDVSGFDTKNVTNMGNMFNGCNALTSLDVSSFDTKNVTNMSGMFQNCNTLTSLDVSSFDTANVKDMYAMFQNCNALTSLDLSNFDTTNVKDMSSMFYDCKTLTSLDLSNFDTTNVTNMSYMFFNNNKLTSLDVSGFDTTNVTNMGNMFNGCNALTSLDVSNFDTKNVTNMVNIFNGCNALTSLDVSNFDTSNVTSMTYMFYGCDKLDAIGLIYSDINTINALPIPTKATLYIDKNIDQTLYTGSSILKIYESRSVNINLPTALRSNGTIADRLYWDETDKHYYIEQWIDPNTKEILEEPNIIASGIVNPIEIHQYEKQFSVDLQNISPSYMAITVPYFDIPDDYEYNEADEVEYFKQSFELRFPDEDDYDPWYGFLGVNTGTMVTDYTRVSNGFATTFWSYDDTTLNFSSDTTVVSVECYMDNELITSMPINTTEGSSIIISGTNKIRIVFASIPKAFYIDDKKYIFGEALSKEIDKDPYLGQEIDSSRGIKRLVDWVDGCSDEEFVRDFEQYFHKDYTLRYYLLVITLGMVDNLG